MAAPRYRLGAPRSSERAPKRLRIGCDSISSEWTTDSEAERAIQEQSGIVEDSSHKVREPLKPFEEKQNRRKRKKRAWRLRHWLSGPCRHETSARGRDRRREDSASSGSSNSSSSTSSGSSSSTDGGELGSFKRQRQQVG